MKKTLSYILLSFFTGLFLATTVCSLNITIARTFDPTENRLIAEDPAVIYDLPYKQPIIPKPNYLPGPEEDQQIDSEETIGGGRLFVTTILPRIAVMMIGFVGSLSLAFLVIAGFRFATNYGNDEAIDAAKKQAIFSVLGFLLALLSYAIVAILTNIKFVDDATQRTGPTEAETEETTTETTDDSQSD